MNNLGKKYKNIMVMAVIFMGAVFFIWAQKSNATSLQNPKQANPSVKAVRKHTITPNQARNFLNGLDMPTRDYENVGQSGHYGRYEADSDRFILETRDSNRFINNLSYSVFGDKNLARAVELELNVNDISFSSNAVNELIKYSDYLMYKVIAKHLTPEMKTAMYKKVGGEWIINGYKIKLEKEIFPDEKPVKGVESTSDHGAFSLTFLIEL